MSLAEVRGERSRTNGITSGRVPPNCPICGCDCSAQAHLRARIGKALDDHDRYPHAFETANELRNRLRELLMEGA